MGKRHHVPATIDTSHLVTGVCRPAYKTEPRDEDDVASELGRSVDANDPPGRLPTDDSIKQLKLECHAQKNHYAMHKWNPLCSWSKQEKPTERAKGE